MITRVGPRWGNSVQIAPNPASNLIDEVTVFDTGLNSILATPAVCTLTLDLDGTQTSDDRTWARIAVGLGGYEREFEIDWLLGQQINFAANRVRVTAKRLSGANPKMLTARASIALGSRSTSSRPPTWTTAPMLIDGVGVLVTAPKHAKSMRLFADDAAATAGIFGINQNGLDPTPASLTLQPAEVHDWLLGKFTIPVVTPRAYFSTAAGPFRACIVYELDL